jgi:hypothetical protein
MYKILGFVVFVMITRAQVEVSYRHVGFEASTATVYNEVFPGDQSCQHGVGIQRFSDCFPHQGLK